MRSINESMARWIWFHIITGSRRTRNRMRLQQAVDRLPDKWRKGIRRYARFEQQLARRIAVPALRVMLIIAWGSLLLTAVVATHTYLLEHGFIKEFGDH